MTDILTKEQRTYCMSKIHGKNTVPEILLRKALWRQGFRHRILNKLPGKPDIVYKSIKTVIFVDGCFWHRCPEHFKPPKTRSEFWEDKITRNVERDQEVNALLESEGWLVIRVWEHEIRKSLNDCVNRLSKMLSDRRSKSFPAID